MLAADDLVALGHELDTRPADPGLDGIDDVVPQLVVAPGTPEAVAATLRWAAGRGLAVVIRGGGSKAGWGARPGPIDVILDMTRLNRILTHQAGDLTVSVEAGIRLRDLNERLAAHGQWLALDPPHPDDATIGGLLASNDSGPQRHRFGTPRDLAIGIQLATADGALAKAGGQVVKNVAGYDLAKIISGSFGALAAVVSATFKLSPVPGASATLLLDRLDVDTLAAVVEDLNASQLEPVALEARVARPAAGARPEVGCLIRFASFPAVVEAEIANAAARVSRMHQASRVVSGEAETRLWAEHGRHPWDGPGIIARIAWRPGQIKPVLEALIERTRGCGFELAGRLGIGAGLLRIEGEAAQTVIGSLRSSELLGNVIVVRAPLSLRSTDFVWGPPRNPGLMSALKRELDPAGVLGAGRGPV